MYHHAFPWKSRLYTSWRQFFFNPVGIIFSRICPFNLPDSPQDGSLWGALLETPQEGPGVGLTLHSPEKSVTHSLAIAKKNCL